MSFPEPEPTGPTPSSDPRQLELARMSVSAPATFLILNGILGLILVGLLFGPLVFRPEGMVEWLKEMIEQQPPGPDRQQAEEQLADLEKQLRERRGEVVLQNLAVLGVGAVLNLLAVFGGWFMLRLSAYPLAMTAAVVSLIPCATGCCVTGIPFAVWALVVLTRPEIKAAFLANRLARNAPSDPDAPYLR